MAAEEKRYKNSVLRFFNEGFEEHLIELQNELIWKTYKLGVFSVFEVHDPKRRTISSLPFRDRIIQIALCNIVEPIFERRFIYDSYACRVGKGSVAAANRLSYFIGKPDATKYLKCDIHKFFYSVDVDILERIIKERFIEDPDVLWLIDTILRHEYTGLGIKIGNRFSQLAANVILNEVDFHFKVRRQTPYYIRYMDDIIILHCCPV
jgi:retron-type reverse transcriptase